jgi:16S rRNA (guanine966-N2)-methyltransferase
MRVISGTSKGRKLVTRRGQILRPTSGRIKESIFGILGGDVAGKGVLDLFAGTGNLGIEALSRGARKAFFVERERQALHVIQKNLSQCGMEGQSEILPIDAIRAIRILEARGESFDLIFMDPPYERGLVEKTLEKLKTHRIYHESSILIVQRDRREPLPETFEGWTLSRERRIGDTIVSFLMPAFSSSEQGDEALNDH